MSLCIGGVPQNTTIWWLSVSMCKWNAAIYKLVCKIITKIDGMSQTRHKYSRAIPFIKVLDKSKSHLNKSDILKKFPEFVTNDIIDVLYSILVGKLHIKSCHKKILAKHKNKMHEFVSLPSLKKRRNFIYEQKGGFLGAILPAIISVLGNLFT